MSRQQIQMKQKIINLAALILGFLTLFYLNQSINYRLNTTNSLSLFQSIANNNQITQQIASGIKQISQMPLVSQEQGINCFLRAFYEIKYHWRYAVDDIFYLFGNSSQEYGDVTRCQEHQAILLYRAERQTLASRAKIIPALSVLQRRIFQQQYPRNDKQQHICVYFHTYNNQATIKQQIENIVLQGYDNTSILIEDDGSQDYTYFIAQKQLEKIKNTKIQLLRQQQRKGLLYRVKDFLRRCPDDSIVVVLSSNETLLSNNAFHFIQSLFSLYQSDLLFFSSLQTPYLNIKTGDQAMGLSPFYSPFIAFKKQLGNQLKIIEGVQLQFEKKLMAIQIEQAASSIRTIPEVLTYHPHLINPTSLAKLHQLLKQFNQR